MQKNSLREPENETWGQQSGKITGVTGGRKAQRNQKQNKLQSRALPSRPGHTAEPRVALFSAYFFSLFSFAVSINQLYNKGMIVGHG